MQFWALDSIMTERKIARGSAVFMHLARENYMQPQGDILHLPAVIWNSSCCILVDE
ncbi:hypothetical protein HNQ69_000799 [Bartonella callosciuri]|uniref:Uncharacterized protein n=1 Tax=Bartonella callosciuri TaxID=686223 RepID=A0A840NUS2_9HYPH|nr:hypothetical protein [Bartonella callosciuri]MBB5073673.1 hypothetical protein [Bartonella callosciuri]